jgi:hypothetical protein
MFSNIDKFTSVFLMLLSGFLWWSLGDVPADVAYYPKAMVFCLFGCSLILFIQALISRISHKTFAPECSAFACRRPTFDLVGLSVIYIIVLPYLGFITSSVIFLVVLMLRLGVRNWLSLAGVSIATVVLVYLGFEQGLMVPLPDGYSVWSIFY